MGGYGSTLVQEVTCAGSVALGALNCLTSYWHGAKANKMDDNAGGERSKEAGVEAGAPFKVQAKL